MTQRTHYLFHPDGASRKRFARTEGEQDTREGRTIGLPSGTLSLLYWSGKQEPMQYFPPPQTLSQGPTGTKAIVGFPYGRVGCLVRCATNALHRDTDQNLPPSSKLLRFCFSTGISFYAFFTSIALHKGFPPKRSQQPAAITPQVPSNSLLITQQ